MNILLIGNGFDLAHGLPTKYTDFLEFCTKVSEIFTYPDGMQDKYVSCLSKWEINEEIKEKLIKAYESRMIVKKYIDIYDNKYHFRAETEFPELNKLYELIEDNFWLYYFCQNNEYRKENWIDFEKEISKVIKSLDADAQENGFDKQITQLSNYLLQEKFVQKEIEFILAGKREGKQLMTFSELRDTLLYDLNKFIRAFEIYLTEYVEKIDIKVTSPDIENIIEQSDGVIYCKVLSFNYTKIYINKYFGEYKNIVPLNNYIDYIHGKAESNNTIESNNMVLGIDEYLPDDRKNVDIEFIAFKKFYQRIYKQTGCKYKEWVKQIKKDYLQKCKKQNLYIFGHSLDVTDKDILRDLILNDSIYTTIFYYNKAVMGQQIANLVKVIGQDELIKRTGENTKTIEFKQQQDMIPYNSF